MANLEALTPGEFIVNLGTDQFDRDQQISQRKLVARANPYFGGTLLKLDGERIAEWTTGAAVEGILYQGVIARIGGYDVTAAYVRGKADVKLELLRLPEDEDERNEALWGLKQLGVDTIPETAPTAPPEPEPTEEPTEVATEEPTEGGEDGPAFYSDDFILHSGEYSGGVAYGYYPVLSLGSVEGELHPDLTITSFFTTEGEFNLSFTGAGGFLILEQSALWLGEEMVLLSGWATPTDAPCAITIPASALPEGFVIEEADYAYRLAPHTKTGPFTFIGEQNGDNVQFVSGFATAGSKLGGVEPFGDDHPITGMYIADAITAMPDQTKTRLVIYGDVTAELDGGTFTIDGAEYAVEDAIYLEYDDPEGIEGATQIRWEFVQAADPGEPIVITFTPGA